MGIRETLNQKPAVTTAATLVIIVIMLAVIVYQSWDFSRTPQPIPTQAWFTVDDGKNWFPAEASNLPPWEYDGRPVYRVFVFTCDGGKTTFAGYLLRYTPETLKKLADEQTKAAQSPEISELLAGAGVEVKAPLTGETGWIKRSDPRAMALVEPVCKGTNELATAVNP